MIMIPISQQPAASPLAKVRRGFVPPGTWIINILNNVIIDI